MPATVAIGSLIDARELSRLRWRCRRGLLENDLFVARFFERSGDAIPRHHADGLLALMDLADNDLLDLLLRRKEPEGDLARDDVIEVLGLMRKPKPASERDGPQRACCEETTPPVPHSPFKERT